MPVPLGLVRHADSGVADLDGDGARRVIAMDCDNAAVGHGFRRVLQQIQKNLFQFFFVHPHPRGFLVIPLDRNAGGS
jgi:hypothetical protein